VDDKRPSDVAAKKDLPLELIERAMNRPRSLSLDDIATLEAALGALWPIDFKAKRPPGPADVPVIAEREGP
jgi:hypothetical protein